ncbi:MAG: hypothetical protein QXT10_03825 [Candidatus Bathyarchaeia archaeon]
MESPFQAWFHVKNASMLEMNGKLFIYHHEKTMVIEDVGGKVDG